MSRAFVIVLISLAGILSPSWAQAQACVPPPPGLVGWWSGNGSAADAVAGNNGQLFGDATFAPAIVNQGFSFDGVDDHVEIPESPALEPDRVSVEAWVRFDSLETPIFTPYGAPGYQVIVFKQNTNTFQYEGYSLHKERHPDGDHIAFGMANAYRYGANAASATSVEVGTFYHVVGTYDGSYIKLYVNGVLEGQTALSIVLDYGDRPLMIGASGEPVFDGKLNGIVDEASVYNRALSDPEVAALYTAGPSGKCSSATGLIANLAGFVQTLNLSNGIANSFDAKLQNVLQALDEASAGDKRSACNRMSAFLNEVSAQAGKTLGAAQAAQLALSAQQIQTALGCR